MSSGSIATLQCAVTGNPGVTSVTWKRYRGGVYTDIPIDGSKFGGASVISPSLIIYNTNSADTGSYVCMAENGAGTTESDIVTLSVSGSKYITVCHVVFRVVCHVMRSCGVSCTAANSAGTTESDIVTIGICQ